MSSVKNGSVQEVPQGLLHEEALKALRDAVWDVIQDHKRHGIPLIWWRDGKIVHVPPEQAEIEYLAAKAQSEAESER
jgi:hypothetical protein